MGASPEQLEREIGQVREELGDTIDRIAERASVRRIVAENPWPLVIGLGVAGGVVAWLLGRRRHG